MIHLVLCALLLLSAPALGQTYFEEHIYRERRGDHQSEITWRLERGDALVLTAIGDEEIMTSHLNRNLSTRRWEVVREGEQTVVAVERRGNELHLAGRLQGEPLRRILPIDASPWYQALSISLRPFVDGDCGDISFWMLRPDTLEAVRLMAVKKGEESVTLSGGTFTAQRVQVRPTGWGELVWRGRYWFRQEDGVFLRFEAPRGLPGSLLTVIELYSGEAESDVLGLPTF